MALTRFVSYRRYPCRKLTCELPAFTVFKLALTPAEYSGQAMERLLEAIPAQGSVCLEALRGRFGGPLEPVLSQLESWRLVRVQRQDGAVAVSRTPDTADYLRCLKSRSRR